MRMRAAYASIIAMDLMFAAACGTSPTSAVSSPGSSTQPAANPSSTTPPAHGLVGCIGSAGPGGGSANPAMADLSSGRIIWTQQVAQPTTAGWGDMWCSAPGLYGTAPYNLESFSRDFRRVAAVNGASGHVGWVDAATGLVTDVTQMAPPPSPAFGQSPSKDIDPKFAPSDDSFWFERVSGSGAASVMRLASAGSRVETVATLPTSDSVCGGSPGPGFSWEVSKAGALIDIAALAYSFDTVAGSLGCVPWLEVNPQGSTAFACNSLVTTSCYVRSPLDAQWKGITLTGIPQSPDSLFRVWISDSQLILFNGFSAGGVYLLTLGATATLSTLIQPAVASYLGFALGSDGKSLVFLATSASSSNSPQLYTIALDGSGQPTPLSAGQGLNFLLASR